MAKRSLTDCRENEPSQYVWLPIRATSIELKLKQHFDKIEGIAILMVLV